MPVDQELVQAAIDQADRRHPKKDAVAAGIRVASGEILTGVGLPNYNAALTLCAETGPICTAYSAGLVVSASVCVHLERSSGEATILAPCGACRERLALWGPDVQVGVADPGVAHGWSSQRLGELNPFYWAAASTPDGAWPASRDHEW